MKRWLHPHPRWHLNERVLSEGNDADSVGGGGALLMDRA